MSSILCLQNMPSVERQKGLTASHSHMQLDHFAPKLKIYGLHRSSTVTLGFGFLMYFSTMQLRVIYITEK